MVRQHIAYTQDIWTHPLFTAGLSCSPGTFTAKDMQSEGRLHVIFKAVSTSVFTDGSSYLRSMWMQGGYSSWSICTLKLHCRCSHGSQDRTLLNMEDCCWYCFCTGPQMSLSRTYIMENLQITQKQAVQIVHWKQPRLLSSKYYFVRLEGKPTVCFPWPTICQPSPLLGSNSAFTLSSGNSSVTVCWGAYPTFCQPFLVMMHTSST